MFANIFKPKTFVFYLIFKLAGLAPFSYIRKKNGQILTTRYSPVGVFYNLILIVLLIVSEIDLAANVNRYDMMNKTSLVSMSFSIHAITSIIGSGVIILTFCWKQKKFVTILNTIAKVDHQLAIKQDIKFNWILFFYSLFILTLIVYNYIAQGDIISPLHFFAMFGGYITISYSIIQYAMVLKMFRSRFETVNHKLKDFSRKTEFKSYSCLCNSISVPLVLTDLTLQKLREVHEELIGAAESVNEFYGFPMLISTGVMLYNFASNAYFLYVFSSNIWSANFILTIHYCVYKFIPIWILVIFVGQTLREVCQ